MTFQSHGNSLAPPKAENKGKGGCEARQIRGGGWKGNPVFLADSVSLDEQKAKGDVKKKGRLDPYAYIPLNRTKLNRRYSAVQGCGHGARSCALEGFILITLNSVAQVTSGLVCFYFLECTFMYLVPTGIVNLNCPFKHDR